MSAGSAPDAWPRWNRWLTIAGGVLLTLESAALGLLTVVYFFSTTICGLYCEQAWEYFGRGLTALAIGGLVTVGAVIGACVWRRWSSVFLLAGILVLAVTFVVMMLVGTGPLGEA